MPHQPNSSNGNGDRGASTTDVLALIAASTPPGFQSRRVPTLAGLRDQLNDTVDELIDQIASIEDEMGGELDRRIQLKRERDARYRAHRRARTA